MNDAVFREMDKIFRGMITREIPDAELAEDLATGLCVIKDGMRIPASELFNEPIQPDLEEHSGCRFYGKAETITGDLWWYEVDGIRKPLRPVAGAVGGQRR